MGRDDASKARLTETQQAEAVSLTRDMMTTLDRFLKRWRAWGAGLRFVLFNAARVRVHVELVLEVIVDERDHDQDLSDFRTALPGWQAQWCGEDRVRLVPPARVRA